MGTRIISVFAPKGGVGKTTTAVNLAVAISQLGQRTVLIDGSLQFGDLRSLLKVPSDAPSVLDLPTDRIAESDLGDVLWRDPSGIDILLAPPRIEMAEMVSVRDMEKALSLLRRLYGAVVVDMPSALGDIPLALLDAADTILEIVTYDSTTIRNTLAIADAFRSIGYPASKVRYVVNRADSSGGIAAEDLARALGRVPEHTIVSDGKLVVQANNEGLPCVLASPDAPITRYREDRRGRGGAAPPRAALIRWPIRARSASSTRESAVSPSSARSSAGCPPNRPSTSATTRGRPMGRAPTARCGSSARRRSTGSSGRT
jgi:pilus assembly protein CpaE